MRVPLVQRILDGSAPLAPRPTKLTPRGRLRAPCRAILFDVYGTLFVSGSGDVGTLRGASRGEAFLRTLAACGLETRIPGHEGVELLLAIIEAHHRRSRSRGIPHPEVEIRTIWTEVLEALRVREGIPLPGEGRDLARLVEELALTYELLVNPTWPMPGLAELLGELRRRKVALGIVSNAQFYTPLLFEAHLGASPRELGFLPTACVWSFEEGRAKPDEQLFLRALEGLASPGILAEEVLYVGNDLRNDVAPARRRGLRTALFAGDARSLRLREGDPTVAGIRPDLVCTDLRQILAHACP